MSISPVVTCQALPPDPELAGKIVRPGEAAFGEARSAWNLGRTSSSGWKLTPKQPATSG